MLLFCSVERDTLPDVRRAGTPAGTVFFSSLEEARRQGGDAVLVVERAAHAGLQSHAGDGPALPASAFENLQPYDAPEPVTAAGGYVLRADEAERPLSERHLLLIHRRGVWDLPKGKQDPGEDVQTCAVREVQEETGLGEVHLRGALGPTVHGYAEETDTGRRYCVKTTHWFLMETPETDLTPERAEGIERAEWIRWEESTRRLGYETLQRHQRGAETRVRELTGESA